MKLLKIFIVQTLIQLIDTLDRRAIEHHNRSHREATTSPYTNIDMIRPNPLSKYSQQPIRPYLTARIDTNKITEASKNIDQSIKNLSKFNISINDKGALDYAIKARVEVVVNRSNE